MPTSFKTKSDLEAFRKIKRTPVKHRWVELYRRIDRLEKSVSGMDTDLKTVEDSIEELQELAQSDVESS